MPKRPDPAEARYCKHCGRRVTSRGRRSATNSYYCSGRSECQAAKQRDWRARNFITVERKDAPNFCSHCGKQLKPRKVRVGDSPFGRWCSSARCQAQRLVADEGARKTNFEELTLRFYAMIEAGRVQECPECGLEDGVAAFVHPKLGADGKPVRCEGLGIEGVPVNTAKARWPQFYGES